MIGATEADGGHIKERRVTPGDLAATIYKHMGVPPDTTYLHPSGRPRNVVEHGSPIAELFCPHPFAPALSQIGSAVRLACG